MNVMKNFNLKMVSEGAKIPMRSTKGSAGYDVFADKEYVLPAGKVVTMKLPFAFKGDLDQGVKVRLFVRSSFGIKKKVRLVKGEEKNIEGLTLNIHDDAHVISVLNDNDSDLTIAEGEHFAQFIISKENPKEEKQKIESLTSEELGEVVPVKGHMEVVRPNVYDYVLEENITFVPHEQKVLPSGLRTVIEEGTWTAIDSHSDVRDVVMLANQKALIDYDYQNNPKTKGNCFLAMVNLKDEEVTLPKGTKLTRWYTEKYYTFEDEIKSDKKRIGGIGSTTE